MATFNMTMRQSAVPVVVQEPKLGILQLTCVDGELKHNTGNMLASMNPFCTFVVKASGEPQEDDEEEKKEGE
jgi:hypothetical protein